MNQKSRDYFAPLDQVFSENRNDVNAESMYKYMKELYAYYGIKSGPRRQMTSDFIRQYGLPDVNEFRTICIDGMNWPKREMAYVSMEIAFKMKKHLTADDHVFIAEMVLQNSWWDTVDFIASNIAGYFFTKFPELREQVIHDWIQSDDMWINRTAILFQLKYKNETDFQLLQDSIEPHRASKEFFHQKAIGWALRQYAKFQPEKVLDYVNNTELKPLSRREALKHF